MTPQLILTLSPAGALQAELPAPNGSRRVIPLDGEPESVIASLHRMLIGQRAGLNKVGELGAPTAHEISHYLSHNSPVPTCPFCNLGLQHSNAQCTLSAPTGRARKKVRSRATQATILAYAPTVNPEDLGL